MQPDFVIEHFVESFVSVRSPPSKLLGSRDGTRSNNGWTGIWDTRTPRRGPRNEHRNEASSESLNFNTRED